MTETTLQALRREPDQETAEYAAETRPQRGRVWLITLRRSSSRAAGPRRGRGGILEVELKSWLQKRAIAEHRTVPNLIEKILVDYREAQELQP